MLWVYGNYEYFNYLSAGTDFIRQNLSLIYMLYAYTQQTRDVSVCVGEGGGGSQFYFSDEQRRIHKTNIMSCLQKHSLN